jgi:hypothetical protein
MCNRGEDKRGKRLKIPGEEDLTSSLFFSSAQGRTECSGEIMYSIDEYERGASVRGCGWDKRGRQLSGGGEDWGD